MALRRRSTAVLVTRSPGDGRTLRSASIPWTPQGSGLAPILTPLPKSRLLVSGSPLDLTGGLSGLGPGAPAAWVLTSRLRVLWRRPHAGRLVALGTSEGIFAALTGFRNRTVQLAAFSWADGHELWTHRIPLPSTPETASFHMTVSGNLLWAVTWGGGGRLTLLQAATGQSIWQVPTRLPLWTTSGPWAIGGAPPWSPLSALEVRRVGTGRAAFTLPIHASPVAAIGGRVLLSLSLRGSGSSRHPAALPVSDVLAWLRLPSAGSKRHPVLSDTSVPGGAPPYTAICTPFSIDVLTPWLPGALLVIPETTAHAGP
jgi:hypothetical protein